jgi:hypothetical protein
MKGKSSSVTHGENDYFIKNNGIFSLFFWKILWKNLEKYKKKFRNFVSIFLNGKKTTHKNTHTQQQHHMGPISRKIQCQIIKVQKLGIKKKITQQFFILKNYNIFSP